MASKIVPSKFRQIIVKTLGTDFRSVTEIIETAMPTPGPSEVLIKNKYVGINASDINFTAGRYFVGQRPPFPCGFEGIGNVVRAGIKSSIKEGQAVFYSRQGAFAEYLLAPAAEVVPVPSTDPALMSLAISGITASIALEKEANLKPGQNVLVTAASGGTGQFAVQLAKAAGCHVIGTCSSEAKVEFLKSIGCDRPINYKTEDLGKVLSKEYPNGLDVVYESIGKEIFDTALKNLAVNGRLIVIGQIASYEKDNLLKSESSVNIPMAVLTKSASVRGFFLVHYKNEAPQHIMSLLKMYSEGKLKIALDRGPSKPFVGLDRIADAIDYMYSGKNVGKVIVDVAPKEKSPL